MVTGRLGMGLVIASSWLLIGTLTSFAVSSENPDAAANPVYTNSAANKLVERMDRLENRVTSLEMQVVTLQREKNQAQESLKRQQDAYAALKAQRTREVAEVDNPSPDSPPDPAIDPREGHRRHDLISSYGVRAGYQGFPFGQREGGFFYGFFLDHLLVQQSEGMPAGDLDLEIGAGVARSGNDEIVVNSTVVGEPTKVDFRQRMISVWPGLKYRYDRWKSYGLMPYLTGGPGIWVDIIETPPLVGGLQFPTAELGGRKIPATAGASLFEGAQGGAGFEFSFARFKSPIFQRMKLGFDYRYAAWTTGQRFSTYSLLLSYRE
jgi:hypothetical protein